MSPFFFFPLLSRNLGETLFWTFIFKHLDTHRPRLREYGKCGVPFLHSNYKKRVHGEGLVMRSYKNLLLSKVQVHLSYVGVSKDFRY